MKYSEVFIKSALNNLEISENWEKNWSMFQPWVPNSYEFVTVHENFNKFILLILFWHWWDKTCPKPLLNFREKKFKSQKFLQGSNILKPLFIQCARYRKFRKEFCMTCNFFSNVTYKDLECVNIFWSLSEQLHKSRPWSISILYHM